MDSPSAQLVSQIGEESEMDLGGRSSSPFETHVGAEVHNANKQYRRRRTEFVEGETAFDVFQTPFQSPVKPSFSPKSALLNKENIPAPDSIRWRTPSLRQSASPPPDREMGPIPEQDILDHGANKSSMDSAMGLPPPTSSRKGVGATSRRSPLKSRGAERTPRSISRGSLCDKDSYQTVSSFQTGLDMRSSALPPRPQDTESMDDTCVSAFSAVPDLTLFAKLGQSPTKRDEALRTPRAGTEATPRASRKRPSPSRSPSPTPRRQKIPGGGQNSDGTTSFLIDFTQQMDNVTGHRAASPSKSATESNLLQYINSQRSPNKSKSTYSTPNKQNNLLNLLDFELPPAPTPRSVPTITVRELESLKSSYLSQISSLKATLNGREAEVESLKRAVADAERRAGEAQETLRNEKCKLEFAEQEKGDWEKRAQEIENRLKSVKEEVIKGESEKEDMQGKMMEYERRAEEAEERAMKAEQRYADAVTAKTSGSQSDGNQVEEQVQKLVAAQIDSKIEAVSRELHAVYKEKHERKVATLKKSYEARNEKKCADLQARLSELEKQNEDLAAAKDATFSGPVDQSAVAGAEAELKARIEEQKGALARLEEHVSTSQQQQEQLMRELEQERIEKGDLVAAVDEMLALQAEQGPPQGAMSVVEDFRRSISRPSGLRTPGSGAVGESRIGHARTSGIGRGMAPNTGSKSKMLANIERMGRAGGSQG